MAELKAGDSVRSIELGYYFGINGRVFMNATPAEDGEPRYMVRLANGKAVKFSASQLEVLAHK